MSVFLAQVHLEMPEVLNRFTENTLMILSQDIRLHYICAFYSRKHDIIVLCYCKSLSFEITHYAGTANSYKAYAKRILTKIKGMSKNEALTILNIFYINYSIFLNI